LQEKDSQAERCDSHQDSHGGSFRSPSLQAEEHQNTEKSHSQRYQEHAEDDADIFFRAIREWLAPKIKDARLIDIAQIVLTVVLIGIGVWAGIIYHGQLDQMTLATNAARNAAYAACVSAKVANSTLEEIRASSSDTHNLAVGSIAQANAVTKADSALLLLIIDPVPVIKVDEAVMMNVVTHNAGRTPAKKVHLESITGILPEGEEPSFSYNQQLVGIANAGMILPEAKEPLNVRMIRKDKTLAKFTKNEVADFNDGRSYVFNYSAVSYVDSFGVSHYTRTCRVFEATIPNQILPEGRHPKCAAYNDTDTDSLLHLEETKTGLNAFTKTPDIDCIRPPAE
jgi:hypothetical protein